MDNFRLSEPAEASPETPSDVVVGSHRKRPYNAYADYFGSVFRGATRNLVSFGARFLLVG